MRHPLRAPLAWLLVGCAALVGPLAGCDDGGGGAASTPRDGGETDGAAGGAGGGGGDSDAGGGPVGARPVGQFAVGDPPASTRLGAMPFPHNLYRRADGNLDLAGVRAVTNNPVVGLVIDALELDTGGFGTSAGFYFTFDDALDLSALPADGAASLAPDATLFLVDVDAASPERGRRWPLRWKYTAEAGVWLPAHALSVRLVEGFALRPATTYALVATTGAATADAAFLETLTDAAPPGAALAAAHAAHAPLRAWLAENPTVEAALATVFTTQDPVSRLFRARDHLQTLPVPPLLSVETRGDVQGRFELFDGKYRAPRFQQGNIPYRQRGEGAMVFDADGNPVAQGEEELRFALAVPLPAQCTMPETGWPVALYAHGTGGNYFSLSTSRGGRGSIASVLAQSCIASVGMDQLHHGTRDGGVCANSGNPDSCVQQLYFNFAIPQAGRDNQLQSALDLVSLHRFVKALTLSPEQGRHDRAIRFDPDRIMFMGHSQGSLNGALYLAIEPEVLGGVLSGGGSTIAISLEQKVQPFDLNGLVQRLAGLITDPLDRWHPASTLLQTYVEPGDAVNFAGFWFAEPRAGQPAKSIFMTVGMLDDYTPADAGLAMAGAGRVPLLGTVVQPVEALDLLAVTPAGLPPVRGNVADGRASAGLAQYANSGHFVIFEDPSARNRYGNFLRDLANFTLDSDNDGVPDRPVPGVY